MSGTRMYFLRADGLGVFGLQIEAAITSPTSTKRKRATSFNRLSRVLRDLSLLPLQKGESIASISLGIKPDGERGLFVEVDPASTVQAVLP